MAATSPEVLSEPDKNGRSGATPGHVAALTGLRGFAAIVVVLVHGSSLTTYPWWGIHGYGPIALFTLSGFLLFQPWSRWLLGVDRKPSILTFFWRRAWRIFPAFIAMLLIVAIIYPPSRPTSATEWLRSISLTSIFDASGRSPGLEHTWSLGTELTWYVALPVVAYLIGLAVLRGMTPARAVLASAGAALAVTASWRWMVGYHIDDVGRSIMFPTWLPAYLACFMGGAVVGHFVVAHRYGLSRMLPLRWFAAKPWLVVGVATGAALLANSPWGGPWTFTETGVFEVNFRSFWCTVAALSLLVGVAAAGHETRLKDVFATPWLETVGRWSYGIYLWHMPVVVIAYQEGLVGREGSAFVVWMLALLGISLLLGAATYAFVERPAIAWSRQKTPKWTRS